MTKTERVVIAGSYPVVSLCSGKGGWLVFRSEDRSGRTRRAKGAEPNYFLPLPSAALVSKSARPTHEPPHAPSRPLEALRDRQGEPAKAPAEDHHHPVSRRGCLGRGDGVGSLFRQRPFISRCSLTKKTPDPFGPLPSVHARPCERPAFDPPGGERYIRGTFLFLSRGPR